MTVAIKKIISPSLDIFDEETSIQAEHSRDISTGHKRLYFLGGLLHINGLQIHGALSNILIGLSEQQKNQHNIYMVTINTDRHGVSDTLVGETADQMHNIKDRLITAQGRDASQLILASDDLLDGWAVLDRAERHSAMRKHFSQIVLLGYSYGTSLIQQMERDIIYRLRQRNLPLTPLEAIFGLNIGPVDIPSYNKGLKAEFNNISNSDLGFRPGFRQIFAIRKTDKIMDSVIEQKLVADNMSGEILQAYGNRRLSYIVDYSEGAYLNRIGIERFPEGREVPRLYSEYDSESHDFRLYTNEHKRLDTSSGRFLLYQSSPLAPLIRESLCAALSGREGNYMAPSFIRELAGYHYEIERKFNRAAANYEKSGFHEAMHMIDGLLDDHRRHDYSFKMSQ